MHYHMLEEEHALILEGQVTLLLGDERYEMKPGDYVCFPAGQKVGHSFMNSGAGPCSYLMIGERNPNEVCVYPGLEQDGGPRPAHGGRHFRHVGGEEILGRRADGLTEVVWPSSPVPASRADSPSSVNSASSDPLMMPSTGNAEGRAHMPRHPAIGHPSPDPTSNRLSMTFCRMWPRIPFSAVRGVCAGLTPGSRMPGWCRGVTG